jgi:hypothetical protein
MTKPPEADLVQTAGRMVACSAPEQVAEIPARMGLPSLEITIACTDPDAAQSPPGRRGRISGVGESHQITGRGWSPARPGSKDHPAAATSGAGGEFPLQAEANRAPRKRDRACRAGRLIPAA